jgi:hypothetical protein
MKVNKRKIVTLLACCTGVAAFIVLLATAPVFAVHDQEMEIEGNVANDNVLVDGDYDWADLFDVDAFGDATAKADDDLPDNFGPVTFIRDFKELKPNGSFNSSDDTTFATGSKDTLNPGPFAGEAAGWQCTHSNNVGNQVDLINVYATAYADPGTGELKIYFGAERNDNNGTKNIGFWFLKDQTVGCVAGRGETNDFTGNHMNGDLFVVSEFSTGGKVSSINVYQWVGGGNGFLDTDPIYTGVDCKDAADGDEACATVNSPDNTPGTSFGVFTPPWLTQTNQSGKIQSTDVQKFEFFEGGLNLTALGLDACFNRFLVNTRSSDSLTATIFDFAAGNFELCGISAEKVCADPADVGPNPVIDDTDYESFITIFDVTIEKIGPAGLFDVTLEEASSFGNDDTCKITGIFGCSSGAPTTPVTGFEDSNPVEVCGTLGVDPITVRIECDTGVSGYLNSVTAKAATSDGGVKTLSDPDTMTGAEACTTTVNPALSVEKICHDLDANHEPTSPAGYVASHPENPAAVDLKYDASKIFAGFGVDVFVQIENTGNIKLNTINLTDPLISSFTPVTISQGSSSHTATTFDGTLLPGIKAYFTGSYVAWEPDGASPATNPCLATFTDRVTVTAVDATSDIALSPAPFDDAMCPLCVCPE